MKLILAALFLFSCSLKPIPKDPPRKAPTPPVEAAQGPTIESKQIASQEESNLVTEITFPKEKSSLTKSARKELQRLNHEATAKGKIKEIKVITWADKEYPGKNTEKLSEQDQKLVKARNEELEKYLKDLGNDAKIEKISMAERPGEFDKIIQSDEAQVKKHVKESGVATTEHKGKLPGKASKSIVIYIMEE